MKFIVYLLTFVILTTWHSKGNEKVIAESKKILQSAEFVDLLFHTGFSGQAGRRSVALLYLLGEPGTVPFFASLTEKSGAPSIYGLIGLRQVNPDSELYKKCLQKVIARDGDTRIVTAMADVIGEAKVKDLLLVPGDAKNQVKLKFGDYYSEVFPKTPEKHLSYVVDNGLLGEQILNPCMFKTGEIELTQLSVVDRKQVENAKIIVSRKLLHRHPGEVLKLYGFESDDDILYFLKKDGD
jgi:hypothetical protein